MFDKMVKLCYNNSTTTLNKLHPATAVGFLFCGLLKRKNEAAFNPWLNVSINILAIEWFHDSALW